MRSEAAANGLRVELSRISLERGGTPILRDLDWTLGAGERWVLLGRNGAGKTQLLKLVAGDVWPTPTGREQVGYHWRGERFSTPLGVKDEIAYVGAERQDRYERYEWNHTVTTLVGTGLHREDFPLTPLAAADRRQVGRILRRLDLEAMAERRFLGLSYGERRIVLVARALAWDPQLLLLDELLNGLDTRRRTQLLAWLEGTRRSRRSWVLATHRREDLPRSATHLLILEDGRAAYAGPLRRAPIERWFGAVAAPPGGRRTRKRAANARPVKVTPWNATPVPAVPVTLPKRTPATPAGGASATRAPAPLVELENAAVWLDGRRILEGLSFRVRPGECWVVHGGNGAGKSTLLRTLYGDHGVAQGGRIRRRGVVPGVPLEQFKRRVGLVAPHLQADHPLGLRVAEVVQTGRHASIGLAARATRTDRAAASAAMRRFGIEALGGATLREISYGQFRRVLFARAWINRPRLLLLDEPFEGLDPPTREALVGAVEALIREGVAVVLATHHRDEWPAASSHELELVGGMARYAGPVRAAARAVSARLRRRA